MGGLTDETLIFRRPHMLTTNLASTSKAELSSVFSSNPLSMQQATLGTVAESPLTQQSSQSCEPFLTFSGAIGIEMTWM